MTDDVKVELFKLKQNLDKILNKLKMLEEEHINIKGQLVEALDEVSTLRKKNQELENKNLNLQVTRTVKRGKAEQKELKQRIDNLIGEVDKCIANLSGQDKIVE